MKILVQTVKINVVRTLEIKQRLEQSQDLFKKNC